MIKRISCKTKRSIGKLLKRSLAFLVISISVFSNLEMPSLAEDEFIQPRNPVIKSIFTADPEAHVWPTNPNKLYIYPSHDTTPFDGCGNMDMYHVFSTENMVDFIDEGEILRRSDLEKLSWMIPSTDNKSFMWAPDAAYKDGWYYFYNPVTRDVEDWKNTWETSVVRSRYPDRGFEQIPASAVDANPGKPWEGFIRDSGSIDGYSNMYDVAVRIYDGEAYIYNGAAQTLWQGKLKDDMVTVVGGKLQLVTTDKQSLANDEGDPGAFNRLKNYHEGPSSFRRMGPEGKWIYYLIYPGNNGIAGQDAFWYSMADTPLGPWGDAQVFFNETGNDTSHGSIVEFKGKWYWVYHTMDLSGIGAQRSVAIDEVIFNDDGTIQRFGKTSLGVPQNGPDYVRPSGVRLDVDQAIIAGTGALPNLEKDNSLGGEGFVLTDVGAENTSITFNNVDGGTGNRARLVFRYSTEDELPKLNLFVNGINYKAINFPKTGGSSIYSDIEFTVKALNPGKNNTIELKGTGEGKGFQPDTRLNLNYVEVILFDDSEPAPGYFNLAIVETQGGTANAKWNMEDANTTLEVAAGAKVTLSYDEGAGEFEGWDVVKPSDLVITDNTFYMPYGEVEIKPIFNNQGNARRPIINTAPLSQTVIQGSEAELFVEAIIKDEGTISYQWYVNSEQKNSGGSLIQGAESERYTLPSEDLGENYYYVVITNTNNSARGAIKTATTVSEVVSVKVEPQPSTECDIVTVSDPFQIDGTNINGIVSNQTTAVDLASVINVSDKATWTVYSDKALSKEKNKIISPLLAGNNLQYIRVTAQDGITSKEYTVNINRKASTIGRANAAISLDGSIDPAVWGNKIFTLAEGKEGMNVTVPNHIPEDFSADVYMTYDDNNVYVGLIVTDSAWEPAIPGSGSLWKGCGIQFNLWSGREGARAEYGFALTEAGPAHYQWSKGAEAVALSEDYNNYHIKRVEGTDTFIYTIAIPLNSFREDENLLSEGQELWFSICYNYPGGGGIASALDMGFHSKTLNDARAIKLSGVAREISEVFTDIQEDFWARDAIAVLYSKGIISDYEDNLFRPNNFITRGEFIKLLSLNDYSVDEQQRTQHEDSITRIDAVILIYNALENSGYIETSENISSSRFSDFNTVPENGVKALDYLSKKGYVNGYDNGTFIPNSHITRAEAAVIIYNLIK